MATMARLEYGRLTQAWKGEASDFTPLLAEQLDQVGAAINVDLASVGRSEVQTAGGRRIDIIAQGTDGAEFVVENQYGRGDHDHLTRGLAYAVARRARGLIIVAEEHRDEFRAVAQYLNEMAEFDPQRGIAVWLVEAKAVRIGSSEWAPLFAAVVEPNGFTMTVEQAKQTEGVGTYDDFWSQFSSPEQADIVRGLTTRWLAAGHRCRLGPNHVVLEARGPSISGIHTVVAVYADGRVLVPFGSYAGQNSGIEIPSLTKSQFRSSADALFGFLGSERQARTIPGWLTADRVDELFNFCIQVAAAFRAAMEASPQVTGLPTLER